ncbi:hypothetical protein SGFS_091770 [Streptomyces graminofaciens]|uniref:Uncharacterized protein n=1 Tax=Streptomyces graminofaciens TaxID=68212 RepID=A0ABN5VX46_9ACTN|nr:hypothetical protein SGFS_091770 [Streptomyces graminofaciens]
MWWGPGAGGPWPDHRRGRACGDSPGKPYPWQRIGIPVEVVPACASLYGLTPVQREPVRTCRGICPERPPTLR